MLAPPDPSDQDAMIEALFVDQYLRDESQRELGNRGVPPSIDMNPQNEESRSSYRSGEVRSAGRGPCPRCIDAVLSTSGNPGRSVQGMHPLPQSDPLDGMMRSHEMELQTEVSIAQGGA